MLINVHFVDAGADMLVVPMLMTLKPNAYDASAAADANMPGALDNANVAGAVLLCCLYEY